MISLHPFWEIQHILRRHFWFKLFSLTSFPFKDFVVESTMSDSEADGAATVMSARTMSSTRSRGTNRTDKRRCKSAPVVRTCVLDRTNHNKLNRKYGFCENRFGEKWVNYLQMQCCHQLGLVFVSGWCFSSHLLLGLFLIRSSTNHVFEWYAY